MITPGKIHNFLCCKYFSATPIPEIVLGPAWQNLAKMYHRGGQYQNKSAILMVHLFASAKMNLA